MKLSRGEIIRNREERKFRNMLASRIDSRQSRVWTIINSPFFNLVFATIFIGLLGTIWTKRQECFVEANRLISKFNSLRWEISNREGGHETRILQLHSIYELPSVAEKSSLSESRNPTYAGNQYSQLLAQRTHLLAKIDFSESSEFIRSLKRDFMEYYEKGGRRFERYYNIYYMIAVDNLDDADLDDLKEFAMQIGLYDMKLDKVFNSLTPNCGLTSIVKLLWGERTKIVRTEMHTDESAAEDGDYPFF